MKKKTALFCILVLTIAICYPATAKPANQESLSIKRLNELTNRFSALESTWGRYQIGGNLSIESNSYVNNPSATAHTFNFEQHLGLYLDAYVEKNLMFSLKMAHHGGWGLNYQSLGSSNYPMTAPVETDEAFVRLEYPTSLNYFGRFRFTISPVGLITDYYENPLEGIALQKSFSNYHLIGIYSRVNTEYLPGTDQVTTSEDYFAARFGWSNETTVLGVNLVPNGITGEKAASLDVSYTRPHAKLSAELGYYSFKTARYPDYQVDWTPGFLLSYGRSISKKTFVQIKAAYITSQFGPSYSSLAHVSGDNREWFTPNSKGVELFMQNQLGSGFSLENRLIGLLPVENYDQPEYSYHFRSSLFKYFSPVNHLELGIDSKKQSAASVNQIFLRWSLSF